MTSPLPSAVFRHPWAMILDARRGGGGSLAGHEEDLALAENALAKGDDLDNLARKTIEGIGDGWSWLEPDGEEWSILTAIAGNPGISKKTTKRLLWVGEESDTLNRPIAEALGRNPSRFVGRLEDPVFSEDVDRYVSFFTEDADILRELAFHTSSLVREGVATNRCTPADLVEMLTHDPNPEVRYEASRQGALAGPNDDLEEAADPTTPDDRLQAIGFKAYNDQQNKGSDPEPIYLAVADNPNASARTLFVLLSYTHKDKSLERKALQLVETNAGRLLARLSPDDDQKNLDTYIAGKTSNVATLRELAMLPDDQIRSAVAFNEHTPNDLQEALSRDPSFNVVRAITTFASRLSVATQKRLAQHEDSGVRHMMLLHTEEDDVISLLIETEPYFMEEDFWWNLKQLPNATTKHLKAWVDRYNREATDGWGENLTLKEFEEWEL